jgi:hypothetical protein
MALRFRKSVKLAPGVKLNFGKRGGSVTLGPRGASVNIGSKGAFLNTSIPGTGISSRTKIAGGSSNSSMETSPVVQTQEEVEVDIGERGELIVLHNGEKASPALVRAMWQQKEKELKKQLKEELAKRIALDQQLVSIASDVPDISKLPPFIPAVFEQLKPQKPIKPGKLPKPAKHSPPGLSLIQMLSSQKRAEQAKRKQEAEQAFEAALTQWQQETNAQQQRFEQEKASYPQRLSSWKSDKADFEAKQKAFKKNYRQFIGEDVELMEYALESHLKSLVWPRETLVDYQLSVQAKTLSLDVDLPEIEDFPQYTYEVDPSGKRLKSTKKRITELREQYATHVFGIAVRLAYHCFAQLPSIDTLMLSGYSQRPCKENGDIKDEYLYSFSIDRDRLLLLDKRATPLSLQ